MPKYLFGRPTDTVVKTSPALPLKLQRWLARPLPYIASGRMEDFGLPHPNHNFLEAHPTVSSELLLRLGSGDAVAKPNVDRAAGRPRPLRGRQRRADGRDRLGDGLQDHLPLLRRGLPLGARTTSFPLYKRIFGPGIDDLAFVGFAQTIPTLFPFVELQSKLVARYAGGDYALPTEAEMEAAIRRDQETSSRRTSPTAPGTRCRSTGTPTSTTCRRREIPAGQERARNGHGAEARRPRRRARRRRLPERQEVSFPSEGELCAAWHLTGEGDALRAASRGRPCVVMAHGVGGTKDSGLLPFAEAFAEAGLDVAALRLPLLRRVKRRAAPARARRPPPRRLPRRGRLRPRARGRRPRRGSCSGAPPGRRATSSTSPPRIARSPP